MHLPTTRRWGLSQLLYSEKRLGRSVGGLEEWERQVLMKVESIEMIDASRMDKDANSFLGHSYFPSRSLG